MKNKERPPITTYSEFFRACRGLVASHGIEFHFGEGCPVFILSEDRQYIVPIRPVYWEHPCTSIWGPESVIHHVYYTTSSNDPWLPGITAFERLGLSESKRLALRAAQCEAVGHSAMLRQRLLRACSLKEVPHHKRKNVQEVYPWITNRMYRQTLRELRLMKPRN